jgi:ABC-type transporter Mla maintaining outer membrane lipid asymmetry ATPase subunit MlaF
MLREGKIIFSGNEEELKRSNDSYIHRFIRGK